MHKRFKIGNREKEIIKAIGFGLLTAAFLTMPNLALALNPFLKSRGKKEFTRKLKRLEEKGIIYLGGEKIRLTKAGTMLQKELQIRELKLKKPDQWDSLWRLVSYDIPDKNKKERDWFRYTLTQLGFKKIQESLWVYPYECKEEIALVVQNIGISPHVLFIIAKDIPNQEKWERRFNLKKK